MSRKKLTVTIVLLTLAFIGSSQLTYAAGGDIEIISTNKDVRLSYGGYDIVFNDVDLYYIDAGIPIINYKAINGRIINVDVIPLSSTQSVVIKLNSELDSRSYVINGYQIKLGTGSDKVSPGIYEVEISVVDEHGGTVFRVNLKNDLNTLLHIESSANKIETILRLDNQTCSIGNCELKARLDIYGLGPLSGEIVDFYVDGVFVGSSKSDVRGYAKITWNCTLAPGIHTLKAIYRGNSNLEPSVAQAQLQVVSQQPTSTESGLGKLVLKTVPQGAEVYLNSELKGVTPLSIELSPGSYQLILKKSFCEDIVDTVYIGEGGKSYEKSYKLEPRIYPVYFRFIIERNDLVDFDVFDGNQVVQNFSYVLDKQINFDMFKEKVVFDNADIEKLRKKGYDLRSHEVYLLKASDNEYWLVGDDGVIVQYQDQEGKVMGKVVGSPTWAGWAEYLKYGITALILILLPSTVAIVKKRKNDKGGDTDIIGREDQNGGGSSSGVTELETGRRPLTVSEENESSSVRNFDTHVDDINAVEQPEYVEHLSEIRGHTETDSRMSTIEERLVVNSEIKYFGRRILVEFELQNRSAHPISDIFVNLVVPSFLVSVSNEKAIPLVKPKAVEKIVFELRPVKPSTGSIFARITWFDHGVSSVKEIITHPIPVNLRKIFVEPLVFDDNSWYDFIGYMRATTERTTYLSLSPTEISSQVESVLSSIGMFVKTVNLGSKFVIRGLGRDINNLRYAAEVEVSTTPKGAIIVFKTWSMTEASLTSLHVTIIDELSDRIDILEYLEDDVLQEFYWSKVKSEEEILSSLEQAKLVASKEFLELLDEE